MKNASKKFRLALIILLFANFAISQGMSKDQINLTYNDSVWIESSINIELKKHRGVGFFYQDSLQELDNKVIKLNRTYRASINSGYTIIQVTDEIEMHNELEGKVKFSGSDIDQTQDTLIIAVFFSDNMDSLLLSNLNDDLIPHNADLVKICTPYSRFESFNIKFSETGNKIEQKYLFIQFSIKSGSDDNFYYGISTAVIKDLCLTTSSH